MSLMSQLVISLTTQLAVIARNSRLSIKNPVSLLRIWICEAGFSYPILLEY